MYDGKRPDDGVGKVEHRRMPLDTARSKASTFEDRRKLIESTVPSDFKYTRYSAVGLLEPERTGVEKDTPGLTQARTKPA